MSISYGDVWQLGRHRLLCGDSCDRNLVFQFLDGTGPELIWADPPYGAKSQHKNGTIGGGSERAEAKKYPLIYGDEDNSIAIITFNTYCELYPSVPQIWWGANYYSEVLPSSSCWVVWDKQNGASHFADVELAWTNQRTASRLFQWKWNGYIKRGEASGKKRCHPHQKPVEMVNWYWDKYAKNAKILFDPFIGSGTTIIAAEKSQDRMVYGIELMPEYCEVTIRRYEEETGDTANLLSSMAY